MSTICQIKNYFSRYVFWCLISYCQNVIPQKIFSSNERESINDNIK